MSDRERIIVGGIDLGSVFRFPRILHSTTAALQPGRMIIGLLMVATLITVGRAWDEVTTAAVPAGGLLAPASEGAADRAQRFMRDALGGVVPAESMPPEDAILEADDVARRIIDAYETGLDEAGGEASTAERRAVRRALDRIESVRLLGEFEATVMEVTTAFKDVVGGTLTFSPPVVWRALGRVFYDVPVALWSDHKPFIFGYGLACLIVLTLGGGAISRMAACQWAGQERLSMHGGVDFALASWRALLLAPLWPLVLIMVVGAIAMGVGALVGAPWGLEVIGAVAWIITLLCAAIVAFLLLGYVVGLPLVVPAIACEHCDGPDADQRAYAYVLNRPLHLVGYAVVVLIGLTLGYAFVSWFAATMLNAAVSLGGVWAGDAPALAAAGGARPLQLTPDQPALVGVSGAERIAAGVVGFWHTTVRCLVAAYVVSYLFTAWTFVYLLMRRSCDGQDISEIWRPGMIPGTLTPEPEPAPMDGRSE